jgi:hypothetical protein
MPSLRSRRRNPEADAEPQPEGPFIHREGLLLGREHILHRLADELERARRYHRPLCVAVGAPALLPGEALTEEALATGVAALRKLSRRSDLMGWLDGKSILVIMPETTPPTAASAVFRWKNELFLRTGRKWRSGVTEHCDKFETPDQILKAVMGEFERRNA